MSEGGRKRPTYADIEALPPHLRGEILAGELVVGPRPAPPHARAAATCGNTWCPGGGLTGTVLISPNWTIVGGTLCSACHPRTVGAGGLLDLAGGHHIDGVVDVGP